MVAVNICPAELAGPQRAPHQPSRPPTANSPLKRVPRDYLHSGLVMAQLPRSKEMPQASYHSRSICCLQSSSRTRLRANAGTFEHSDPSFHTRMHRVPRPGIRMPTHAASHLTSSPSALGWGAVWPVGALHTLHTAWLPKLSQRPAPATGIGVPASLPL